MIKRTQSNNDIIVTGWNRKHPFRELKHISYQLSFWCFRSSLPCAVSSASEFLRSFSFGSSPENSSRSCHAPGVYPTLFSSFPPCSVYSSTSIIIQHTSSRIKQNVYAIIIHYNYNKRFGRVPGNFLGRGGGCCKKWPRLGL